MTDRHSADHLKSRGYLVTSFAALDCSEPLAAFQAFIHRDRDYQRRFLQKRYGYAYDGFSFYGQTDSSHQAEDDLISTFVLSEFYPVDRYPAEFQGFLKGSWKEVVKTVRSLETALLAQLDVPGLLDFYRRNAGHMVSSNYYPPLQQFTSTAAGNTRLSAHPDASLFTVFPFGVDEELELQLAGENGESGVAISRRYGQDPGLPGLPDGDVDAGRDQSDESPRSPERQQGRRTIHLLLFFAAVSAAGVRDARAGFDDQRSLLRGLRRPILKCPTRSVQPEVSNLKCPT